MRAIDFDCTHTYRRTPINEGNISTSTLATSYHLHNVYVIQQKLGADESCDKEFISLERHYKTSDGPGVQCIGAMELIPKKGHVLHMERCHGKPKSIVNRF